MIDTHAHLEQKEYRKDIEKVIGKCKENMRAVITSAPDPKDYDFTFDLVKKNKGFVFATAGIHPEYVERFTEKEIDNALEILEENKEYLVGIGETGLDYNYIIDADSRERQRKLFAKTIRFSKRLDLPVLVHIRTGKDRDKSDVFEDAIQILERESAKKVHLHMFGSRKHVERAVENEPF